MHIWGHPALGTFGLMGRSTPSLREFPAQKYLNSESPPFSLISFDFMLILLT